MSGMNNDFIQSSPFMLTFTSGAINGSQANISVFIIDDDVVEAPETFSLSIAPSLVASAGDPDTVAVTITDNDGRQ